MGPVVFLIVVRFLPACLRLFLAMSMQDAGHNLDTGYGNEFAATTEPETAGDPPAATGHMNYNNAYDPYQDTPSSTMPAEPAAATPQPATRYSAMCAAIICQRENVGCIRSAVIVLDYQARSPENTAQSSFFQRVHDTC